MRNINDIIQELSSHPDFLTAEIFCKSDLVDYIVEDIQDELDVSVDHSQVNDWVEKNKSLVINNIKDVVCDGYNYTSPFYENVEAFKKQNNLVESEF